MTVNKTSLSNIQFISYSTKTHFTVPWAHTEIHLSCPLTMPACLQTSRLSLLLTGQQMFVTIARGPQLFSVRFWNISLSVLQYFFKVMEAVAESFVVKQSAVSSAVQPNIENNGQFFTHRFSARQNKMRKLRFVHKEQFTSGWRDTATVRCSQWDPTYCRRH